ncbi:MAG: CoA-binding protein [Spirochaetia bacterium]|nr:CoA-binding protein [Spirochaetia bacterium]
MFDLVAYLKTNPRIALVGATNDASKFGNIILRDMVSKGYSIVPVNPRATAVEGIPAVPDLAAAQKGGEVGLVVYVVPPALTRKSLEEADKLGLKKVWIQPGAGDQGTREFLDEHNFDYLMDACVMVETRN